ncbi:serine/threonine-protein kinase [Anaerolineales bacterium HSG6]|nr:serine/threonine-protein kinase [Anaerolineales bacterium HSG6]
MSDIPKKIDNYSIIEKIGEGGMGVVYLAKNNEQEVVLKTINPNINTNEKMAYRLRKHFEREIRVAGRLKHPNVVTVYSVNLEHEPPYLVMEKLSGGTLGDFLFVKRKLFWKDALKLLQPVVEALIHVHEQTFKNMNDKIEGLIHRDIKPANLMFAGDKEDKLQDTIKIVDFGLARWKSDTVLTRLGKDIKGALPYMPPEQALAKQVDRRVDIYALGIILFEAIAGHNPQLRNTPFGTEEAATSMEPIDMASLLDKAPPQVIELITKAVAKDKNKRYPDCQALLADWTQCIKISTEE